MEITADGDGDDPPTSSTQQVETPMIKEKWMHHSESCIGKFERKEEWGEEGIHVRIDISGSPLDCPETSPSIGYVRVKHRGILLTLKGTVIRSGAAKMYEGKCWYKCWRCNFSFPLYPELETRNSIVLPSTCPSQGFKYCDGTSFQFVENSITCHVYQEIKIQESTHLLGVGAIPRSILVVLKDDHVDRVKAGDDVIVTRVLTAKWSPDERDVRYDLKPVLIANFIRPPRMLSNAMGEADKVCGDEDFASIRPLDMLQKYIQYVKEHFRPISLEGS